MSFVDTFDNLSNRLNTKLENFIQIICPLNKSDLECIVSESTSVTRKNFGKTMRLFAPLYLSNECVNNCTYCGFSRDNSPTAETKARMLTGAISCLAMLPATTRAAVSRAELLPPPR